MTVLVYRDGVMAADSRITYGHVICGSYLKVQKLNGFLVGVSGSLPSCEAYIQWFREFMKDTDKPVKAPSSILDPYTQTKDPGTIMDIILVREKDGAVFTTEGISSPARIKGKFFATGSGWEIAMGAMEMGATAIEAVKAVCKWDTRCGLPIKSISFNKKRKGKAK